jgi:hypothetical protein
MINVVRTAPTAEWRIAVAGQAAVLESTRSPTALIAGYHATLNFNRLAAPMEAAPLRDSLRGARICTGTTRIAFRVVPRARQGAIVVP